MTRLFILAVAVLGSGSGCGKSQSTPPVSPGPDGGAAIDGGSAADAGGVPDAGPTDAGAPCTALSPASDGTSIPVDLVLSEIRPREFIELFNTTAQDITLGSAQFNLCSPFDYASLRNFAPSVVVPAGGYATIPWPVFFTDTAAGGEVILYRLPVFDVSNNIVDFVCWGTNPHSSRKGQAESVGKWSGPCVEALTNGSLHRKPRTPGTGAASYDRELPGSSINCRP